MKDSTLFGLDVIRKLSLYITGVVVAALALIFIPYLIGTAPEALADRFCQARISIAGTTMDTGWVSTDRSVETAINIPYTTSVEVSYYGAASEGVGRERSVTSWMSSWDESPPISGTVTRRLGEGENTFYVRAEARDPWYLGGDETRCKATITVNVAPATVPSVTLGVGDVKVSSSLDGSYGDVYAYLPYNTRDTVSWTSTDSDRCRWGYPSFANTSLSGSYNKTFTTDENITLTCDRDSGLPSYRSAGAIVRVKVAPKPTADLQSREQGSGSFGDSLTTSTGKVELQYECQESNTAEVWDWNTGIRHVNDIRPGNGDGDIADTVDVEISGNPAFELECINSADYTVRDSTWVTYDPPNPPLDPEPLTLTTNCDASNDAQVHLSWDNVANETGYRVWRSPANSLVRGFASVVRTTGANVTSWTDTGVNKDDEYRYWVEAFNADGDSGEAAATITTDDCVLPDPAVNISATDTDIPYNTTTQLWWDSENATSCTGTSNPSNMWWNGSKTLQRPATNKLTTPRLTTTTTFTITCSGAAGTTADSDSVTVTVNQPPNPADDSYTVPYNSSDNIFDVLSNDSDPDPGDSLTISLIPNNPDHGDRTNLIDRISYTPNTGYFGSDSLVYQVSDGTDTNTATVNITVSTPGAPPAPTVSVTTRCSSHSPQNVISWNNATGATDYKIYRKTNSTRGGAQLVFDTSAGPTSWTDTTANGVVAGQKYWYWVRAINAADEYSEGSDFETTATCVTAPTVSSSAVCDGPDPEIDISWSNVSNATEYYVYKGTSSQRSSAAELVNYGAGTLGHTDSSVNTGTRYYYWVEARNAHDSAEGSTNRVAADCTSVATVNFTVEDTDGNPLNANVVLTYTDYDGDPTHERTGSGAITVETYSSAGASIQAEALTGYQTPSISNSKTGNNSTFQLGSGDTVNVTVRYAPGAPSAPTNPDVGTICSAAGPPYNVFTWTDTSNNEDGFQLWRDTSSSFSNPTRLPNQPADTESFRDNSPSDGVRYYYRVRAYNNQGNSSFAIDNVVTSTCSPPTVNLSASPTSLSTGGTSRLSWSTTNADACTASSNPTHSQWNGPKAVSGNNQPVSNITSSTRFLLECSGPAGNGADDVYVTVIPPSFSLDVIGSMEMKGTRTESTSAQIRVRPAGGFNSNVTFSIVEVVPPLAGTNFTFLPNPVAQSEYNPGTYITAQSDEMPPTGNYQVKVKGEGGGIERVRDVYLYVQRLGDRDIREF